MSDTITTDRLTLRRFAVADIAAVTTALQDIDIVRMLPRMPWPYTEQDAERFITQVAPSEPSTFVIEINNSLVGSVSANEQLGYWLVRTAWGQGYATEASRAVLKLRFDQGVQDVPSGHRLGNHQSRNVLTKLGFRDTQTRDVFNNAEHTTVTLQDMILTRQDWEAAHA